MTCPWTWINQPDALERAAKVLAASGVIAIDTEYNSLHYFREKLCLIQIHDGDHTYLIDPLAGLDLRPLEPVFSSPAILKIFHAGDNDIRIIKRDYGFTFRCIFDTQRAAALLGHHYLSLETLIKEYLAVEFSKRKKTQRSRWETRPLTQEQLHYASLDTFHLIPLYLALKGALHQKGLGEIAEKAFQEIAEVTWREKIFNPIGYKRLPGYANLVDYQKQRLRNLYRWRYEKAREIDRAPFLVLDDRLMMILAQAEIDLMESAVPDKSRCGAFCRYVNELIPILQESPQA
ncbi:MAG: ribonuclease D [Syntrophaceae bacterium]|nr:ribonuclease D [Syntrophaceae bacterium]